MSKTLNPDEFLQDPGVILDVRSPAEYTQGHIPGAISFPLFSDQERAQVGICYKQKGRDQAVELGFALVGPRCADLIAQARILAPDGKIRIYCWRGGMRSSGVAWILEMAGFEVFLLNGGYKAFRRWGRSLFSVSQPIILLGGMTGTGKTEILNALRTLGEQTLDLEDLANHRGSSYGALGQPPQPTNEQFWNLISLQWSRFQRHQPVWIEAESKRIGICRVPQEIFQQMEQAPVIQIQRTREERLSLLVELYGTANREDLIQATKRIHKHLGGLRTSEAINLIQQEKLTEALDLILHYYDKAYTYDLQKRSRLAYCVDISGKSTREAAILVRQTAQEILSKDCVSLGI
ncbi:tRNA 2-selenouridine(34) synthase MnmH [Limnoraphis robusta Tam1]|uniref:tRNA 2-selenouridine(34) synthase MnmH n=1 Tax=Limnoraphis robusta CCNP1315 TaxID=3110306 RepID=A0ABU5U697_9CYAN|nr:tRNA 2-selenouridine(34) synthase MnmH [Limnoraphis robusta]MEA5521653.1 tRNA 2-selenouridine(34) synthase MnmH [Limnoraphis robusta CCNP1315]MEA5542480.1 tRNA 2-selenouridine(34) synthase MnmH [Limnoraphis robusta Tam1]MEA5548182.1 tRNA 2-selenouridine(34) synthase MnmH [Limnoraphis robusta CCNP1324]